MKLVAALYKFVPVQTPAALAGDLRAGARALGLRGTLLVAAEGINGTLCGEPPSLRAFLDQLRQDVRFRDLSVRESWSEESPFRRLKVQVKREICTLGRAVEPARRVGTYVEPEAWHEFLDAPEVLLVDVRNSMEIALGSFPGAMNPGTERFSEWPAFVDRRLALAPDRPIAMFCTGGIRCEKATSLLIERGHRSVYHLRGGILAYLERVPAAVSRWAGACFVFDERIALDRYLRPVPREQLRGAPRKALPPALWGEPGPS